MTRWEPVITCTLAMHGLPASADYVGDVKIIITYESGGNPNAINNWDINAQEGHPSQGLMQTIPSTFEAYRSPNLANAILDPAANIYAGIGYAVSRYGSLDNVPGVVRVKEGLGYVGYAEELAATGSLPKRICRSVRFGAGLIAVQATGVSCARGDAVARSFERSSVARAGRSAALRRERKGRLSRRFKLHGYWCQYRHDPLGAGHEVLCAALRRMIGWTFAPRRTGVREG